MGIKSLLSANRVPAKGTYKAFARELSPIRDNANFINTKVGQAVVSEESFDGNELIDESAAGLRAQINQALVNSGMEASFEAWQVEQAVIAGLAAQAPNEFHSRQLSTPKGVSAVVTSASDNVLSYGVYSEESYRPDDIRNFQYASMLFTLFSTAQTKVNELFWTAVPVDVNESGVVLPATLSYIFNDYVRNVNGQAADIGRRNTVRFYVDPDGLTNHANTIVPVVRPGNGADDEGSAHFFTDPTIAPYTTYNMGNGVEVTTSYLKPDEDIGDIIGMSQTDRALNNGVANYTDTINPAVRLTNVLIKLGDQSFDIDTRNLIGSQFVPSQQEDTLRVDLIFDTKSAVLKAGTADIEGNAPTDTLLQDYNIRFGFSSNGFVLLDIADMRVSFGKLKVIAATNKAGVEVDAATLALIAKLFEKATIEGFKTFMKKDNLNLREKGLLTETKNYNILIQVPYRDPISTVASVLDNKLDVDETINNLINLQNIACAADGISRIFEVADVLRNYEPIKDKDGARPGLDAYGSYWVLPYFFEDTVRALDLVDGLRSGKRREDESAGLWNYINAIAMNMIRDSEYVPAGITLTKNPKFKPTLIIATDMVIYNYLTSNGLETEYEREQYNIKLAFDVNKELIGKIVISLSHSAGSGSKGNISPLDFGAWLNSVQLVSNNDQTLQGQKSRYITVTPRFEHTWTCPVLAIINVEDITALAGKLTQNVQVMNP